MTQYQLDSEWYGSMIKAGPVKCEGWRLGTWTVSTIVTGLNNPRDVTIDSNGNLYIANYNGHDIKKWVPGSAANTYTRFAGTGTAGTTRYADTQGGFFVISNTADAAEVITVRGWNGSSTTGTIMTPTQNETALCYWTGATNGWIGIAGADA